MKLVRTITQFLIKNEFQNTKDLNLEPQLSEERLLRIIDNLPVGLLIVDINKKLLWVNAQLKEWFPDFVPEKATSSDFLKFLEERNPEAKPIIETHNITNCRNEIIQTSKGLRYFEIDTATLKCPSGSIDTVIKSYTDITGELMVKNQLKHKNKELLILNEVRSITNRSKSTKEICRKILEAVIHIMEFEYGAFNLINSNTDNYDTIAEIGLNKQGANNEVIKNIYDTIIRKAVDTGETFFADKLSDYKNSFVNSKDQVFAVIPLSCRDKLIGVLILSSNTPLVISADDRMTLTMLGPEIGNAFEFVRSTEALIESEKKYRDLFENAGDILFTADFKGDLLTVNKTALEFFGYSREDISKGLNLSQILCSESYKLAMRRLHNRLAGIQSSKPFRVEVKKRSGEKAILEYMANLIFGNNEPVGIQGMARDITGRVEAQEKLRKSEEKYRSLVESSEDIVYSLDREGRFLHFHGSGCFDIEPEQLVGKRLHDFIDRNSAEFHINKVKEVFRTNKQVRFEILINRDNKETLFSTTLAPIRDADGKVVAVTGICRDVTESKRMQPENSRE
ncbi:MAG: PAS domain S-box protein [candidate division Zixibacteria bacterium]|nr:PAS domain S-box protein [candidate division Zixibacteria bacterium]